MLNKFRRWLRRKGRAPLSLQAVGSEEESRPAEQILPADGPLPEETAEKREAAQMVREALDYLSPDHRTAIELRFIEDLSYEEIGRVLGCPVGTAKSRVHYALRKIGAQLGPGMAEEGGSH
jgi:RNA polymerase sigma-70 factor (ECF subfamily)